jgi:hypothetical protein
MDDGEMRGHGGKTTEPLLKPELRTESSESNEWLSWPQGSLHTGMMNSSYTAPPVLMLYSVE